MSFIKYTHPIKLPAGIACVATYTLHASLVCIHTGECPIPIPNILMETVMRTEKNVLGNTYNSHRLAHHLCAHLKQSEIVQKCGVLRCCIGFSHIYREYDAYEEIYMGVLPRHSIPYHHIAYSEWVVDECVYYVAIETSIQHLYRVQLFVELTKEALLNLLYLRYTSKTMVIDFI